MKFNTKTIHVILVLNFLFSYKFVNDLLLTIAKKKHQLV